MARSVRSDDADDGATGEQPERTCAVTRAELSPSELIRFVRGPDGNIVPDLGRRLPGRGVWLQLDRGVVETAARQNAFARSLKRQVTVPDGLADLVEHLLRRRCQEALAIANKAGVIVAGFAKVDAALDKGTVVALIHAADAAVDGRGKLDRKLMAIAASRRAAPEAEAATCAPAITTATDAAIAMAPTNDSPPGIATAATATETTAPPTLPIVPEIVTDLTSAELSLALGRENVVHAALSKGGAAQHFLIEAGRFRRYRLNSHAIAGRPPRMKSNTEQV